MAVAKRLSLGAKEAENIKSGGLRSTAMSARKVGEHVEIPQDEARAGETGHHVRYILAAGVALVVLGFGALALGWFS